MSALSTPDLSPVLSPNSTRRLSSRRGSIAAADPWGAHNGVNMNPSRSMTSRLTIVRVPQPDVEESLRRHRRHGSNASINSTSSGKGEGPGGRLSFAFTSFSGPGAQGANPGRPGSPSGSPRLRPSSPVTPRMPSALPTHSRLSPDQLLDIARISCNPRVPSPHGPLTGATQAPSPVSFTPLADSIYLPFIDRPAEVSSLIQAQPNARLFALLQQTFPPDARASMGSEYDASKASPDPTGWTFADLEYWFKYVDRDVADDTLWIRKARRCIMTHSELIWERVKGALGVPPELDVDEEELEHSSSMPALTLTTENIDANVFEPDSPVMSVHTGSELGSMEDEIIVEPVFAGRAPLPSLVNDPMSSSLGDLREEDEEETAEEKKPEDQEVQGLRFTTSPSVHTFAADNSLPTSPMPGLPSPVVWPRTVTPAGVNDRDVPYDMLRERGPGHALFPSNFAQLSLSPTLRSDKRTQSMSYPPRPAYNNPHTIRLGLRAGSIDAGSGGASRPEWTRNYDPSKHEYAVTTESSHGGSVNGGE